MRLSGLLDRDAPEDPVLANLELPTFFDLAARVMAIAVGILALGGTVLVSDGDDRVNVVGTLLCVLPWLPWVAGSGDQARRWGVTAALLGATALLAVPDWANGDASLGFGPQFTMLFPMIVLVGYVMSPRRDLTLVVAAITAVLLLRSAAAPEPQYGIPGWLLPLSLGVAGAVGIRRGAVEIARGQQTIAALEAADERRQVTREVHAAVSHTLTVTLAHVSTARAAIRRACSPEAAAALEEAERYGRSSLADVRRIIRLLRSPGESALDSAQPDLADVAGLVADYRAAGRPVSMQIDGDMSAVPATVGLVMYQVLQEALANAVHHGSGPARVEVRVADGHVEASVTNLVGRREEKGPPGAGIARMRERAEAAGGVLAVTVADGCWEVRARLPTNGFGPP